MVWLSIAVNLSTSTGHDSLNRLACENKRAPNAAMTKKVRNKVIIIATYPVYFYPYKKIYDRVEYDGNNGCENERNNNALGDVQYCEQGK